MALITSIIKLFFILSPLIFLSHAKLNLDRSDYNAFKIIQRDLGIDRQHSSFTTNPCNSPAVSCEIRLSSHNFTQTLKITRISYDSKKLRGFMSPVIGQLSDLRELTLSNNQLVHQLPREIVDCKKLEILNLKNNRFSGDIPSELSKLSRLREIDLSLNKFSGNAYLSSEVSRRSLVPKRYRLAENSYSPAPSPSPLAAVNEHEKNEKKKKKKKWGDWLLGFIVGGILGTISGTIFATFVKAGLILIRGRKEGLLSPVIFSPLIKKAEDLAFLEKEDGFASLQMIGKGGCGEVYKAELPGSDGKIIAIKKIYATRTNVGELTEDDRKKMHQIRSEIQTVGRIRHRNLVSLLAHVPRPDCHLLVYEYMKNGSLQDIMKEVALRKRDFDWSLRYRVTLGVAAGLEYLHMNNNPRIIHRDLKPGNILLDDEMEARISDFGLAREMPLENTHMSTSNLAGTVGYIAPEYRQTFKFTDKCDIFSFGVVIGSLVMGKLPGDDFFQETEEMSLVKWMRNVLTSEEPKRAIDPQLIGKEMGMKSRCFKF